MIAVATKHENVYIDTSAYVAKRYPAELVEYMKKNGKKKVMSGTNFPIVTAARCLKDLDTLRLSDEVKRLFLCDNAKWVFGL
jgi:predicted TIM-barrel fold metal-dependent hydrolase